MQRAVALLGGRASLQKAGIPGLGCGTEMGVAGTRGPRGVPGRRVRAGVHGPEGPGIEKFHLEMEDLGP